MLTLTGTGVTATHVLTPSTSGVSFGDVLLGSSSAQAVMLTNSGNSDVTISNVAVSGAQFSATGVAANTTVAPGQVAVLSASFSPTGAGSASGGVVVNSNASAVSISLNGNGVQASSHSVALTWDPSTSDVIGYYVYRAALGSGSYARLNAAPLVQLQFSDDNVQSGQTYSYVVTSVDADSTESVYSDGVTADIP
jgi:Abnormal spindle-like microcephaly-assoc'd, ASPM-SPD-2-Hydin